MTLKKTILVGVIVLFAVVAMSWTKPALAEDFKIGVMNVQKVLAKSNVGQKAKDKVEEKIKALQTKFKAEEDALAAMQKEIEKKSSAWSKEKKDEKIREFKKERRELQAKSEDARFEVKQLQDKEMGPILKSLEKIVLDPQTDLTAAIVHNANHTIFREILIIGNHNSYHCGQLLIFKRALKIYS